MVMKFTAIHPRATIEHFGYIPDFLWEHDPRPAKEQINERYVSGWKHFNGFRLDGEALCYPGDPPQHPIAQLSFRDERIVLYEHSWVRIVQPNGSWEVCRLD